MKNTLLLILFFLILANITFAGGIRGTIKNNKGEALPFCSITIKGSSLGTMANEDAKFELNLKPGNYEVIFSYLGHQTFTKSVEIANDFVSFDVVLQEQSIALGEVQFKAGKEDAALTIMRKAISMARFHVLEVDGYTARTYVKGGFKILDVPWIVEGQLKKAHLEKGTTYFLESVNDISFAQPNTVKEKVVAKRSNLPVSAASANIAFGRINFYNKLIFDNMVSPLHPGALGYYNFEYLGFFNDRGYQINKIKVSPKSGSQNLFNGYINIVEGTWHIHSLSFSFVDENGWVSTLKQVLTPIQDVWMPVTNQFMIKVSFLGAKGEGNYVTSARDYNLKVNPKYHEQPVVVDEKIDKETALALKDKKISTNMALKQKEITRKQMEKLQKQMEKEDKQARKVKGEDVNVIFNRSFEVDTMAEKRSADFWNDARQVPLTEQEEKGYARVDSIKKVEAPKLREDSIKNLPAFKFSHLIWGHTYKYGKTDPLYGIPSRLEFNSPIGGIAKGGFYNSVEGYYINSNISYQHRIKRSTFYNYDLEGRYSFTRRRLTGTGGFSYLKANDINWGISAGNFVYQINEQKPIVGIVNTVYTLLLEQNYMKLYEKTFASAFVFKALSEQISIGATLTFSKRMALENANTKSWIDVKDREYSSNLPLNAEIENTVFSDHTANSLEAFITWRPFAKAIIFNETRYRTNNGSPVFTFNYKSGFSDAKFTRLEFSASDNVPFGVRGTLRYLVKAGGYTEKPNYFLDFKHFNGNQTIMQSGNLDSYRLLDYYTFSTAGNYVQVHANYEFRQFLLTRIPVLQLAGFKENLFTNYLYTQKINYIEVGYGFQGILKALGFEVIGSFRDGKYESTGFRVKGLF